MIKLFSGCKKVKEEDPIKWGGAYGDRMNIDYSYRPMIQSGTITDVEQRLYCFELTKCRYKHYVQFQKHTNDVVTTRTVTVYLKTEEIQMLYDDPEKFWEVYINGPKTVVNDEKVIIKNEEEYNRREKI